MQVFYTVFLNGVYESMKRESVGLSEEFALLILQPMANPTVLKIRCHHFLADIRFTTSRLLKL